MGAVLYALLQSTHWLTDFIIGLLDGLYTGDSLPLPIYSTHIFLWPRLLHLQVRAPNKCAGLGEVNIFGCYYVTWLVTSVSVVLPIAGYYFQSSCTYILCNKKWPWVLKYYMPALYFIIVILTIFATENTFPCCSFRFWHWRRFSLPTYEKKQLCCIPNNAHIFIVNFKGHKNNNLLYFGYFQTVFREYVFL